MIGLALCPHVAAPYLEVPGHDPGEAAANAINPMSEHVIGDDSGHDAISENAVAFVRDVEQNTHYR